MTCWIVPPVNRCGAAPQAPGADHRRAATDFARRNARARAGRRRIRPGRRRLSYYVGRVDALGEIRALFEPAPGTIYLDAATYGLPPRATVAAMHQAIDEWQAGSADWVTVA